MKYAIAVFRSKTEVFEFIDYMEQNGVRCVTTGTPKEARIGCGISAKFSYVFMHKARRILETVDFEGFYAVYLVEEKAGRSVMGRIM